MNALAYIFVAKYLVGGTSISEWRVLLNKIHAYIKCRNCLQNLLIYLLVPDVMFPDDCCIKGIPYDVTRAMISFYKELL